MNRFVFAAVFCFSAASAQATCFHPTTGASFGSVLGDVDGSGSVNVADALCALLASLEALGGGTPPGCLAGTPTLEAADMSCDGGTTTSDVILVVQLALAGTVPAAVDADGDGCVDACISCGGAVAAQCLVDGSCIGDGTANPAAECQQCDASVTDTAFVALADGTVCSEGECLGGACLSLAPGAPTLQSAVRLEGALELAFDAPADIGGGPVTGYTAECTLDGDTFSASGPMSPLVVAGLADLRQYNCRVFAENSFGPGPYSNAVDAVTLPELVWDALAICANGNVPEAVGYALNGDQIRLCRSPRSQDRSADMEACIDASTLAYDRFIKANGDEVGAIRYEPSYTGSASVIPATGAHSGTADRDIYQCTDALCATESLQVAIQDTNFFESFGSLQVPFCVISADGFDATGENSRQRYTIDDGTLFTSERFFRMGGRQTTAYTSESRTPTASRMRRYQSSNDISGNSALGLDYSYVERSPFGFPECALGFHQPGGTGPCVPASAPGGVPITKLVGLNGALQVQFDPPLDDGGNLVTSYRAVCTEGGNSFEATGASSPLEISGLIDGVGYDCVVAATNFIGEGPFGATVTGNAGLAPHLLVQNLTATLSATAGWNVSWDHPPPAASGDARLEYIFSWNKTSLNTSSSTSRPPDTTSHVISSAPFIFDPDNGNAVIVGEMYRFAVRVRYEPGSNTVFEDYTPWNHPGSFIDVVASP